MKTFILRAVRVFNVQEEAEEAASPSSPPPVRHIFVSNSDFSKYLFIPVGEAVREADTAPPRFHDFRRKLIQWTLSQARSPRTPQESEADGGGSPAHEPPNTELRSASQAPEVYGRSYDRSIIRSGHAAEYAGAQGAGAQVQDGRGRAKEEAASDGEVCKIWIFDLSIFAVPSRTTTIRASGARSW